MHSAKDTLRIDRRVLGVREGWARRVCAIAIATKSIASKTRRQMRDVFCACLHSLFFLHFPKNAIFGCMTRKEKANGQERTCRT